MKDMEKLYRQASDPEWQLDTSVSSMSFIFAVVVIMTMCTTHGVLRMSSCGIYLQQDYMPKSFYHAKNAVRKMGLEYNIIHYCLSGHVSYCGEFENLNSYLHPGYGMSH